MLTSRMFLKLGVVLAFWEFWVFSSELTSHFYKIDCIKENETNYLRNINCEVNKLGKGQYAVTIIADQIQAATYINVSLDIYKRPTNLNVFNITFEYCKSFEHLSPVVRIVIDSLKRFSKDLFHSCPFMPRKQIGAENIPMSLGLPFISFMNIPRGDYKTVFNIRDQRNEFIFYVHLLGTVAQKRGQKNG